MKKNMPGDTPAENLRMRAEALLRKTWTEVAQLPPDDLQKLVQELHVRQIELELQNEELRRTEAALEAEKEHFASFYNLAAAGFASLNEDGVILKANRPLATLLGVEPNALINQPFTRFIFKDDQDIFYLFRQQFLEATASRACELRMMNGSGTTFWANLAGTGVQTEDGPPILRLVLSDIDIRKQAELATAALQESKRNYRDLFDHMIEGFALCQMVFEGSEPVDFVYLAVNEKFTALTGLRDVIGKRVTEILPGVRESDPELFEIYGRVAASGQPEKAERYIEALKMWFELSVYSTEQDQFVVVFDVINERKRILTQLQETARELVEAQRIAALGSYVFDLQSGRWTGSAVLDEVFGIVDPGFKRDVAGWLQIVHPDERVEMQRYLELEILHAHATFDHVYRIIRLNDQQERWVHGRGNLLLDGNGRVLQMAGIIQDITERKRAEKQTRAFARLSERLSVSNDVRDAADDVTATALELFNWDACFLLLYDAASDSVRELINKDTINKQRVSVPIATGLLHPTPMLRCVIEQGGQLQLRRDATDDKTDTRRFGDISRPSLSLMYVPLRHQGHVTGFLSVQSYRRNAYTHQDLAVLQALADHCAGALARINAETALRASEAQLQRSTRMLQQVLENIPAGLFWKDRECRYLGCNRLFAESAGFDTPNALVGKTDFELAWSANAAAYQADDRQVMETKIPKLNFEETLSLPDGSHRWVTTSKTPLYDAHGELFGVLGIYTDITARKLAELALQRSESVLLEGQRLAKLGNWEWNTVTGRHVWSPEIYRIYGRDPELGPADTSEVSKYFTAESWARLKAAVEQGLAEGRPYECDAEVVRADGCHGWITARGEVVRDAGGKVTGLHGTVQDITQRKQADAEMNLQFSALSAAANAIMITDQKGRIKWTNPAFTRLTGYGVDEVKGRNPRFQKSGQHPPAFYATLWATVNTGNVWHGELVNKRKDGRLYNEDMTITPVRGADGQIEYFVAIKQDVTERRTLENQLRQAQKMEAIGTLAGGIAHDFNNMLAAMFGFGYLLQQDTESNAAAQESIGEILKAANRAKELVQQILTFSRQREQKRLVIPLGLVVKEATKFLRASLPAQIKIDLQLAADAPDVLADATQIYQVTMNLATNALHAMEGQPGTLTVKLEAFQPDQPFRRAHPEMLEKIYTRLTVADSGQGMNAQTLERIFEPFFTTKPIGKGTGLGLAVVHGIIQSHDGVITVESEVGRGTTFRLYFPAQASRADLSETSANPAATGTGQKILLLDDEPALTFAFQRLLERLNYRVTVCNRARDAVSLFCAAPMEFDLVITDLTMPEMNGMEVARQIHARRAEVPIVLVSGLTPELTPENLQAAGILALLEKPVALTALTDVLQRALAQV